ncbi:MAG: hypothetical protein ACIAXF_16115 [Phycisphaerales bacterium JB063]
MTDRNHPSRIARRSRGFTLADTVMALGICGFLAAGVLSLIGGVLSATEYQNELRGHHVRRTVLAQRLSATLRATTAVLHLDTQTAVLWTGDRNMDNEVNLSETAVWQWDPDAGILRTYAAPGTLLEVDDLGYDPSADFASVLSGTIGSATLPCIFTEEHLDTFTIDGVGGTPDRPDLFCLTIRYAQMEALHGIEIAIAPRASEMP